MCTCVCECVVSRSEGKITNLESDSNFHRDVRTRRVGLLRLSFCSPKTNAWACGSCVRWQAWVTGGAPCGGFRRFSQADFPTYHTERRWKRGPDYRSPPYSIVLMIKIIGTCTALAQPPTHGEPLRKVTHFYYHDYSVDSETQRDKCHPITQLEWQGEPPGRQGPWCALC